MKNEKGGERTRRTLLLALPVVLLVILLLRYPGALRNVVPVLVILAFCYLMLLAHEMGHVIAGYCVRFRFVLLILGPIKLEGNERRIRLSFNRHAYMFGAVSVPTDERNLRQRIATVFLGGPIASLVTSMGMIVAAPFVNKGLDSGHLDMTWRAAIGVGMPMAALLSLLYFLITIIPSRSPHAMNDGSRALRLLRGGLPAERDAALFAIVGYGQVGRRPRDWNPEIIAAVTALSDSTLFEAGGQMNAYHRNLDCGDIEAAGCNLDRALALKHLYPVPFREELALEAAYFAAIYRQNPDAARNHLTEAGDGGSFSSQATRLRAEAATLLYEGRMSEAREKAEQGLRVVKANALHEREWLQSIADQARGELVTPVGTVE